MNISLTIIPDETPQNVLDTILKLRKSSEVIILWSTYLNSTITGLKNFMK